MRRLTRYLRWAGIGNGRRVAILWPLLILLALFVGFLQLLTTDGGTATTPDPHVTGSPSPTPSATATPPPFVHLNVNLLDEATVVDVIDGDTIDVRLKGEVQRVRYYGIDAPEQGEDCYDEATERNRELVATTVRLQADARDRDENGRLLRYVFTKGGLSVDASLIGEGLAEAWTDDGVYLHRFTALEQFAREGKIGCLWE
jgi:micrococcal nuclease